MDPSELISHRACSEATQRFLNSLREDFSSHCTRNPRRILHQCRQCRHEANRGQAWTGCNSDGSRIVFEVCYDRVDTIEELRILLQHEYQHAKDICSCKQGCDIRVKSPNESLHDFCYAFACMEVRACAVAQCAGRAGDEVKRCVRDCANRSMQTLTESGCDKFGPHFVELALENPLCFILGANLPPFPF